MTEYVNSVVDLDHPWAFVADSEENIIHDLENYTLDPIFELYGNFVNRNPEWLKPETAKKYEGCTVISGNFLALSHAFYLITDDADMIGRLDAAIRKNKATPEYQEARAKKLAKVPVLETICKAAGIMPRKDRGADAWPGKYLFRGEIITITRVYRLTEAEANEQSILYLERWEGRDSEGRLIGGAFHDGDKLPTIAGWALYREGAKDAQA